MNETLSGEVRQWAMVSDEAVENIIRQLLKQPGVQYLREVSKVLDKDPDYLQFHSASVSMKVNEILSRMGSQAVVSDRNVAPILREAIIRLRSFER
ncbi:MAG: hypothetical protein WEB37_06145 [Bacteroidota bacterium]